MYNRIQYINKMGDEIWKVIDGFEKYEVSSFGRVRNSITGRVLKLTNKAGYYNVSLTNINEFGKVKKGLRVHRLVGFAFIENPENKPEINHKDKNKLNNNVSNLEWNSRKENNVHRSQGLIVKTNKNKEVLRLDKDTNDIIEEYNSIEDAGNWAYNNNLTKTVHNGRNAIGNCVNGLSKIAYNYKWIFKNTYESLEDEIWKEVVIPDNIINDKKYFVSNLGRFKNSQGVIMDNYKNNDSGYIRVFIFNKTYLLHRLIALAFLENPENKEQVNHKDGNKLNNKLDNLEFVTNKENQIHKFQSGLGNNFKRKIVQYDLEMNKIKEFNSIAEASKEIGTSKGNIRGVLINYRKTAGGFVWKYLEDNNIDYTTKITINKNRGRNVVQYDLNNNLIKIHNSISEAARNINIHKNNIWGVINNYRKTAGGFIWKYLDEN